MTTDRIIAYWNERVARYQTREEATLLDHNMRALEIETACSWLQPSDRVLDLFCANALTTVELSRLCHSVVGLDLADGMVAAAREQLVQKGVPPEKASVRQGNVKNRASTIPATPWPAWPCPS